MDEILERYNLKYSDLNSAEKETLHSWLSAIQQGSVTIEKVRASIQSMKDAVEDELCKTDLDKKQDIYLKARLRNYRLLEAMLSTPEKAKKQLEAAIGGISNGRG